LKTLLADLARLLTISRLVGGHLLAHAAGGRRGLGWLAAGLPAPGLDSAERLRTVFEQLGGTFLKLGQMLALQPDILSLRTCNALLKLLDRVEPFPYAGVETIFRQDLGRSPEEVFERFERQPFAAASVAQVHVAWLAGRKLAVKVRRPSVDAEFAADLRWMVFAMAAVRRLRLAPLYWLLEPTRELVAWTAEELDFRTEARYLLALRRNSRHNPRERVPAVVAELSGRRILVLEYLDGPPVLAYVRALEAGDEHTARRLAGAGFDPFAFARHVIDNFLSDAFLHGLFHADLHPANLLILPGNVVGYVDFGITGVLSTFSRRHLVALTLAYTRGDLDAMARAFFAVATAGSPAQRTAFRDGLDRLAASWYAETGTGTGPGRRLRKNFTLVMLDMLRLSRATGVLPEREVVKYIRSAIALDGLITRFAPGFDLGAYLGQVCAHHLQRGDRLRRLSAERWITAAAAGGHLADSGASRAAGVLDRLATDEITARLHGAVPAPAVRVGAGGGGGADAARALRAAALVFTLSLLLAFGPASGPGSLFLAQTVLWVAGLGVFARSLRRAATHAWS